jgi:transcriptional regulator with XRE-family HTH domain
MIAAFLPVPMSADFVPAHFRPRPAIYQRAAIVDRPWPNQEVGTGGMALKAFVLQPYGYRPFEVIEAIAVEEQAPFAKLMYQVKAGFGRTMSRLPEVFGVSRQTLYNWLEGETPKEQHQQRLRQLAHAATVFAELGIKPSAVMLDQTVAQGKTFLQLMADGAEGKESAKKLIRIVQRGGQSRAKLDRLLAGRKAKLDASDVGAPFMDENT